ncbi:hypothetical protein SAMN05443507_13239 [Alicyclobacillus tolerans]|uniref:Uncharacterized protein n=1 Tax=Alicyclobacillus tolerans TaxID=90970 RepID=A0A1M6X8N0_9BACL|nr:hypothetical protein SAMN05443507_13239 [Alicyclobacillus montanus]
MYKVQFSIKNSRGLVVFQSPLRGAIIANLVTKRLRMVSWNQELVLAAMEDKSRLSQILGLEVPHDFPSDSVRKFVLPMTLEELERDL